MNIDCLWDIGEPSFFLIKHTILLLPKLFYVSPHTSIMYTALAAYHNNHQASAAAAQP